MAGWKQLLLILGMALIGFGVWAKTSPAGQAFLARHIPGLGRRMRSCTSRSGLVARMPQTRTWGVQGRKSLAEVSRRRLQGQVR